MAPDALKPNCPQCGGPVPVPEGAAYAHCSFCGSESFVDLNGALLYQVIKPTVGRPRVQRLVQAAAHDAGWTGIRIDGLELTYEPVWELELANGSRLRIGARPGPEGRFGPVELPGGERAFVQPSQRDRSAAWSEPELAPESVAEVAARATGRPVSLKTIRLVHHPIFSGHTTIEGSRYDFRLDAVSGLLLNTEWPVRPTYSARTQAWTATLLMALAAAILPLAWSPLVVLAVGAYTIRSLTRRSATARAAI